MPDDLKLRFQLASDRHLEMLKRSFAGKRLIAPAADADRLGLVGDVANETRAIELFADWPVPVLFVAGNHECYGLSWERARAALRQIARGTSVVVLDKDTADPSIFEHWCAPRRRVLSRVRFLGHRHDVVDGLQVQRRKDAAATDGARRTA